MRYLRGMCVALGLVGLIPAPVLAKDAPWLIQGSLIVGPTLAIDTVNAARCFDPMCNYGADYTTTDTVHVLSAALRGSLPVTQDWSARLDIGLISAGKVLSTPSQGPTFGATTVDAGATVRAMAEYRGKTFGAGLGVGYVSPVAQSYHASRGVVVPLWLRAGPDWLHVSGRLWEGGMLADPSDIGAIGIATQGSGRSGFGASASVVRTAFGDGVELTTSVTFEPVRVALSFTALPNTDRKQVGIVVAWSPMAATMVQTMARQAATARATRLARDRRARELLLEQREPGLPVAVTATEVDKPPALAQPAREAKTSGAAPWLWSSAFLGTAALGLAGWALADSVTLTRQLNARDSNGQIAGLQWPDANARADSIAWRGYVAGSVGAMGAVLGLVGLDKLWNAPPVAVLPAANGRGATLSWKF